MSDLQSVVGAMALDLIGSIEGAMRAGGDSPEDFKITGALLFLTAERDGDDGWTFTATNPQAMATRLGLTEMAHNTVRGD